MKNSEFEDRMRALEYFHGQRILPGAWVVIRLDGRGFTRFTSDRFEKPFDEKFHALMVQTAQALLEGLHGLYAYTESDEISILCAPNWDFFDRSLEKIVSISASIASATFTHALGAIAQFDSRIWMGVNTAQVVDYFSWRQADATRCALNGWCYWTARKQGKNPGEATQLLEHQSVGFKNEFLFQNDINFNDLPIWQRRGTGLYWEQYEKVGYNPVEKKAVNVTRRRIKVDENLPMKENYREFIEKLLQIAGS